MLGGGWCGWVSSKAHFWVFRKVECASARASRLCERTHHRITTTIPVLSNPDPGNQLLTQACWDIEVFSVSLRILNYHFSLNSQFSLLNSAPCSPYVVYLSSNTKRRNLPLFIHRLRTNLIRSFPSQLHRVAFPLLNTVQEDDLFHAGLLVRL